jgi:hypothetical protein
MTLALALLWTLANTCVKLSILHLYVKIFQRRKFIWACYAVMFLSAAYCISNCLQNLLLCRPIQYNWDKTIDGVCTPAYYPYVSSASIHMGIDVIIVILPMPVLWDLQMGTSKKISLSIVFGIGILSVVTLSLYPLHANAPTDKDDIGFAFSQWSAFMPLLPWITMTLATQLYQMGSTVL